MTKKEVKKKNKTSRKKTSSKKETKLENKKENSTKKPKLSQDEIKLERLLIENFVGLQKVMVNLSSKFEELSRKISQLLEIFEISAKALAEKDLTIEQTARDDSKIIDKIDTLSNQNKVIARGLTLMHERLSGKPESSEEDEKKSTQRTFEPRFPGNYEEENSDFQKPLQKYPKLESPFSRSSRNYSEEPRFPGNYEEESPKVVPSTPQMRPLSKPIKQQNYYETQENPKSMQPTHPKQQPVLDSIKDSNQNMSIKNSMEGYQKSIASPENQEKNPPA